MARIKHNRFTQLVFTYKEVSRIALRVQKRYFITLFLLSAFWGFLAIPGFFIEKLVLDTLISFIGHPDIRKAVLTVGLLIAARIGLDLLREFISRTTGFLRNALSRLISAEIQMMIARKLSELDMGTLEDSKFKDKFEKIERESGGRAWGLMRPITDIPNYLVAFVSSVGVLVLLHPIVALGIVLFSIPEFLVDSKFIKKGYDLDTELAPLNKVHGWLHYYLIRNRNFMELKILNLSDHLSNMMADIQTESITKKNDLTKKRHVNKFASSLPISIYELAVSLWLIVLVVTQKITIGTTQLYLRSLNSAHNNLSGLVNSFLEIYENYIYVADLIWFLNLKPKIEEHKGSVKVASGEQFSIEFKNVWFRYKKDGEWILKGINFKISPKENIALVGLNGSGKSTLIKLLARFYDPQKGKILIGGVNLEDLDITSWRSRIAVLFQEFESYPFSVKESIGYGDLARLDNLEEIKDSAKLTGMTRFIESLPKKYKNPLDPQFDKGVKPSLGQQQRLGISRMLFRKDASVLILDEPTASVDPEAEAKIFEELVGESKDKILLFVTQRFSTVRLADRIVVMRDGKISELGTHKALMKAGKGYAKLFKLQARGYR